MKTLIHPVTGKTFKLGRKKSVSRRHLQLGKYLIESFNLPLPPVVAHYTHAAQKGLADILGNDQRSCCTSSAAGHIEDVWRGNANSSLPFVTEAQAIEFYSASTGYIPGNPDTDQGGDLLTCMQTWKDKGYFADGSSKLTGWAAVDATDIVQMKTAIWLFGNLYKGAGLPNSWLNPMPEKDGFIWDIAGNPNEQNGHCTSSGGYNLNGTFDATWGMIGSVTWRANSKYYVDSAGGELYVLLSEEIINQATQKTIGGFDFSQLVSDLAVI